MGSGTLKGLFVLVTAYLLTVAFKLLGVEVSQELVMSIAAALAALIFGNEAGQDVHERLLALRARG